MPPDGDPPQHSDDDWMILARSGRPGAFDTLVRRYQPRAVSVAYRYLGQRELAKDVAQNTFIEIYRRLDDYRPHGKFRAYFHRVLLNQCRMAARSRRTRARFQERLEGAEPDAQGGALPDQQILARERQRRIEIGLLRLSEKLRAVVVLQFSGDLSQAEIADALDIKIGTVKSRLSAALVALREELAEEKP
ncbi:MAG TPA: RNA polymerase sigma factor [Kofleriaceae bacterium]|nr:RNA polymerase sigma factor [Kofleriaceae bacterium]